MYESKSISVTYDNESIYLTIGNETRSVSWSNLKNRMDNGDPEALIQNIATSLVLAGVNPSDKAAIASYIAGRQYRV